MKNYLFLSLFFFTVISAAFAGRTLRVTGQSEEMPHCVEVAQRNAQSQADATCAPLAGRRLSEWVTTKNVTGAGWGFCIGTASATFTCE